MHHYTLVFALPLLPVAFAQSGDSGYAGENFPPGGSPGSTVASPEDSSDGLLGLAVTDDAFRGKPCKSPSDCGISWLYCINETCQEIQPGRDCVGEGSIYTGVMDCCPPMLNPHQVNTPCKIGY